jgi:hypothetical protein
VIQPVVGQGLDTREWLCPFYATPVYHQWVGDNLEVVHADESAHVAMAEPQVDINGGSMQCLTGHDLTDYDYVSVGKDCFVRINVKSMVNITRLSNGEL